MEFLFYIFLSPIFLVSQSSLTQQRQQLRLRLQPCHVSHLLPVPVDHRKQHGVRCVAGNR